MKKLEALEVRNLSVYTKTERILDNINLSLSEGERLLVVGRSGSGKTTLLRSITGIARDLYNLVVEGSVKVYGESILDVYEASKHFYYVPQEPWYSIASPYPVLDILFRGSTNFKLVEELAKKLGVYNKLFEASINLSAGEAQRIAILKALVSKAKILLIDEVTSYLDRESRKRVVEAIKTASEYGATVVVVDHDIELWRGYVDKVLYIDKGAATIYEDPVQTPIYEDYKSLESVLRGVERGCLCGDEVVEVRGVWFRYPDSGEYVLKDISFSVYSGELVWVRGGSGRGKSTLLKILAGVLKPGKGVVRRFVESIQLVPENPLHYISNPLAGDEINWSIGLAKIAGLENVLKTPIAFLSSGERRRLAIASAFMRQPRVLLIDEPTVGLDPWNAASIIKLLISLQKMGSAIVVASHGEELEYVSTKVVGV